MPSHIAPVDAERNEKEARHDRSCACWSCIRAFHLDVASFMFDMRRKYGLAASMPVIPNRTMWFPQRRTA